MIKEVFEALADTFCTFKAVLIRIVCTLIALCLCCGSVGAITPEEIHEQIRYAIVLVRQAEQRLRLKNPELTNTFIKERTNDEGHDAEVTLRRLYPKEYTEYIAAKSILDDLLYTQYLMFANGKPQ